MTESPDTTPPERPPVETESTTHLAEGVAAQVAGGLAIDAAVGGLDASTPEAKPEAMDDEAYARLAERVRGAITNEWDDTAGLNEQVNLGLPADGRPEVLGAGTSSIAVRSADGSVVRMTKSGLSGVRASEFVRDIARASEITRTLPGRWERVLRTLPEHGVVVSEFMEGVPLDVMRSAEREGISPEHITRLVQQLVAANKAGIALEYDPGNFYYDPVLGFGVIDVSLIPEGSRNPVLTIDGVLINVGKVLQRIGISATDKQSTRGTGYRNANFGVLTQYRNAVDALAAEVLDPETKGIAVAGIAEQLDTLTPKSSEQA